MDKATVHLVGPTQRAYAASLLRDAPDGWAVTIQPPTRTTEQNALLWPLLTDVSRQVEWHGKHLSPDDWKDIFTATLKNLRVVPNLDGTGFVALGQRTSTMSKRTFSELVELIYAFGAERGVRWSEPKRKAE